MLLKKKINIIIYFVSTTTDRDRFDHYACTFIASDAEAKATSGERDR